MTQDSTAEARELAGQLARLRAQLAAEQAAHAATQARLAEVERQHGDDEAEHRRTEQQLRDALAEKEVLLGEVHHRVKNNLQVISSLLSLQARVLEDRSAAEVLAEAQRRTFAMALVHDKLYRSRDLGRIDLVDYVRSLLQTYEHERQGAPIRLELEAQSPLALSIDHAVPCGLVLHELISLACKHAFPDGRGGCVRIALTRRAADSDSDADGIEMSVTDDGADPGHIDDPQRSLGLRLVEALVRQLRATRTVTYDGGTRWTIRFEP